MLILAISIAGSLLMYPMVNKFAKKKGKKLPIILGCIVFSAAEIVICFSDVLPGNRLILACVFALFVSFPFAVLNVLPNAMMAVHEKGRCTADLIAKNPQGHAGLEGNHKTPVMRMAAFMTAVDEKKPFLRRLHPEVKGMFEALAPHMDFPLRVVFSNLWLFSGLLVKMMPKLNAAAGEMLGTGCTFRKVSTDPDGSCRGEAFLRCINDADFAKDLDALRALAAEYDVEVAVRDTDNEYYRPSSLDSSGYRYIRSTVEKTFPYAAAAPFILPAGTDARRFADLSDAVIRFAPIDIDKQQYASVHGESENISIDKIPLAVDFYRELLKSYQ